MDAIVQNENVSLYCERIARFWNTDQRESARSNNGSNGEERKRPEAEERSHLLRATRVQSCFFGSSYVRFGEYSRRDRYRAHSVRVPWPGSIETRRVAPPNVKTHTRIDIWRSRLPWNASRCQEYRVRVPTNRVSLWLPVDACSDKLSYRRICQTDQLCIYTGSPKYLKAYHGKLLRPYCTCYVRQLEISFVVPTLVSDIDDGGVS